MDLSLGILTFLCVVLGLIFSALHVSLLDMSRAVLEEIVQERKNATRTRHIQRILADISGHARAVALARVVCNLSIAISVVWWVASWWGLKSPDVTHGFLGLGVAATLLWAFSVVIPESISRHAGERFIYSLSGVLRAVYIIESPLAPAARMFDGIVRAVAGENAESSAEEKKDELGAEIMSVVDEGEREGQIDEVERDMIEAVVEFRSRTVEQIMTPRTEIEALELTANLGTVTAFVRKARHSRIPVYRAGGGLDDIVGFFYVKDLLRWLAGGAASVTGGGSGLSGGGAGGGAATGSGARGFDLKAILRPAMFVPESKTIRGVADEFVKKKVHIAVVADEYGGTAGLVTLEDIVEEVFGDIQDEYEKAEDEPPRIEARIEEGIVEVDARAYIADVNDALEPLGVSIPEDDEYDTLGGFVLVKIGHMPEANESFQDGRMIVTVLESTPMRVVKVRVLVRPEETAGEGALGGSAEAEAVSSRENGGGGGGGGGERGK